MARPRKPTVIKKLQGTYRQRQEVQNEMSFDPLQEYPRPPMRLKRIALKYWKLIIPPLVKLKIISEPDLPLLQTYCICMEAIERIYAEIHTGQMANFNKLNEATKTANTIANQFGLNVISRTKIPTFPQNSAAMMKKETPADALDKLLLKTKTFGK